MVVVVMMMTVSARHDDDAGRVISAISGVVVVMMVVVITADADDDLGQLDVRVRGLGRSGFIDGLQQRGCVRDRFEQVGEGIRPHYVGRGRTWRRRGLGAAECPERRHRSQKSRDLLFHKSSSSSGFLRAHRPALGNAALKKWFRDDLAMMSD
jgi:hypothetical protein